MSDFTILNLRDVKDSAPDFGFEETQEARFATEALGAGTAGLSFHVVRPDRRQAFGHRHDDAEEVYVIVSGSGRVKLDDEIRDIATLDAIRVAPAVTRAFEAGPEGLEIIACGPHIKGDGDLDPSFWPREG
jgi:mannose-6-phosphate isomerase-like protein (cupin superfamily)